MIGDTNRKSMHIMVIMELLFSPYKILSIQRTEELCSFSATVIQLYKRQKKTGAKIVVCLSMYIHGRSFVLTAK